jgi:nucleoside-diphosphate-sugar epimerase
MKVLLTGAFGNLGASTLELLLKEGKHQVRCFDRHLPRNEAVANKMANFGDFETVWGNITDQEDCDRIVKDIDCILHLAAIIPPLSEQDPVLVKAVNINGTKNLLKAGINGGKSPKFFFASSVTVHGNKHAVPPPRRADEDIEGTDNYTRSKVKCELEIRNNSPLPWTILRVGAALPLDMLDRDMKSSLATSFGIPLEQRMEFVHPADIATAVVRSIDAPTEGKILYGGGGVECQMTNRVFQTKLLDAMGIGMLPDAAFRHPKNDDDFWYTDYMDTEETQQLLHFQNHSFEDYLSDVKKEFGWRRFFTRLFGPIVQWWMISCSPYYKANKARGMS